MNRQKNQRGAIKSVDVSSTLDILQTFSLDEGSSKKKKTRQKKEKKHTRHTHYDEIQSALSMVEFLPEQYSSKPKAKSKRHRRNNSFDTTSTASSSNKEADPGEEWLGDMEKIADAPHRPGHERIEKLIQNRAVNCEAQNFFHS